MYGATIPEPPPNPVSFTSITTIRRGPAGNPAEPPSNTISFNSQPPPPPEELAGFVGETFYPALGTRLAEASSMATMVTCTTGGSWWAVAGWGLTVAFRVES